MSTVSTSFAKADLGRYKLSYRYRAGGKPTVVFEAGAGVTQRAWGRVFNRVSEFASVVSYDRVNLGLSDKAPRLRSCQMMVDDLHDLLTIAKVPGPYVLVGHSFGGHIARLYTHQYRQEVTGIVLVESTHHELNTRLQTLIPEPSPTDSPGLTSLREFFNRGYAESPDDDEEGILTTVSHEQVRLTGSLGDVPLVVINASQRRFPPSDLPKTYLDGFDTIFNELQEDLVRLSSRSVHIVAEKSGHIVQMDEPELVIDAIWQVIGMANDSEQKDH